MISPHSPSWIINYRQIFAFHQVRFIVVSKSEHNYEFEDQNYLFYKFTIYVLGCDKELGFMSDSHHVLFSKYDLSKIKANIYNFSLEYIKSEKCTLGKPNTVLYYYFFYRLL